MSEETLEFINNNRDEIDRIDDQIVKLLIKRFNIAKEISVKKKILGKSDYDPDREKLIIDKIMNKCIDEEAEELGGFIVDIYEEILKKSKQFQAKGNFY